MFCIHYCINNVSPTYISNVSRDHRYDKPLKVLISKNITTIYVIMYCTIHMYSSLTLIVCGWGCSCIFPKHKNTKAGCVNKMLTLGPKASFFGGEFSSLDDKFFNMFNIVNIWLILLKFSENFAKFLKPQKNSYI